MATDMSDQERRAFLSTGTRTAKLAVIRKNGAPHVVPVWFVLDGDDIVFTTGVDTVKGKALRRDARVAICVEDDAPPFSFVSIHGTAIVTQHDDALLAWSTKIAGRYMGANRAEEFGRRNAVPEELLVRVKPTKTIAIAGMTD
jgi:PPOX class probable F420-dependent enzyme